jgi:hypothetical protein
MLPRLVLTALPLVLCAGAQAETARKATLKLRAWSDHHYAGLVLGARELGRRFREEDVISGAERHFEEQLAQYCDTLTRETAAAEGCRSGPDSLP